MPHKAETMFLCLLFRWICHGKCLLISGLQSQSQQKSRLACKRDGLNGGARSWCPPCPQPGYCYDEQNWLTYATNQGLQPTQSCAYPNSAGTLTSALYQYSYTYDSLDRLTSSPAGS